MRISDWSSDVCSSDLIGGIMFVESLNAILKRRRPGGRRRKLHTHIWLHGLPLKMRFPRSRLYISIFMPLGVGFLVGILAAIMGVGGGWSGRTSRRERVC